MGLRDLANRDMVRIINDKDRGFGWDVTLTDPAGKSEPLVGYSNDISQAVDPDTGALVSGRYATVAFAIQNLRDAGFTTLPRSVAANNSKPWRVQFNDIEGTSWTFKVQSSDPDRGLGMITCSLGEYK